MKILKIVASFYSVVFFLAPIQVDWKVAMFIVQQVWSIFWSYAPTPQPETWYNAFFHVAQYIAANPGRSTAVGRLHLQMAMDKSFSNGEKQGALK